MRDQKKVKELLLKREELDRQREELKKKIEKSTMESHFKKKEGPKKERETLKKIEIEIQNLDHELDEYEDESEEKEEKIADPEKERLQKWLEEITPFYQHLKQGALLAKKKGFFLSPFSRHPKVLIGEKIAHAAQEAKRLLKKSPFSEEYTLFFESFIKEADKAWNRALYEEKIQDLYHTFSEKVESLERCLSSL